MRKGVYLDTEPIYFMTVDEATTRYRLSRNSLIRIARESGAYLKIGRAVRINRQKLDNYFEDAEV